ncbi:hypothetical protein FCIRC_9021 [Fusarium circinatum]|uniref:NACHT domain-containing protein n=1 Tax=Fusarium circinatum TaxID=48490 RepID=A0A8H5WTV4_FUSCI|nr:hypothetical protein FCIRC_9021 [Fusarium circinatum]
MATGFEVVGTFAAVYQLINVSAGLITECMAVHNGERTAESDLKEHAQNLDEACKLTQARYRDMGSSEKLSDTERRVRKTASRCHASARALLGELDFVKKERENYDCMGAVAYMIKSKVHRKKIERMEAKFKNDQQELQIILQSDILSQNKAMQYLQKEGFADLEEDIQILIKQASEGFCGLERFIEAQHKATKDLIVQEVSKVQRAIKEDFTTKEQRKEFLQSFRYPEINKRYNDVLDSDEANFSRVFVSYEKVTKHDQRSAMSIGGNSHSSSEASIYDGSRSDSNIDSDELRIIEESWSSFINWLRSSDSLFCIQGKPGSGKSTLIKFAIDNKNTKRLLEHQNPDTVIMSHFFWKIGSKEQSSIKGFLCSLIHQLLARSEHLQDFAMGLYDTGFHKSYDDWSPRTLKGLLRQILEAKSHAICVFIDGLDEVANDDGLEKLTREIEEVLQFSCIKICVSSRPEALVVQWLERPNTRSILLEDLTRPEMSSYVHKGLDPLLSSKRLSIETHRYLCDEMHIEEMQFERNQELRVIQPTLGQIAFAEMPDRHEILLEYGEKIELKELQEICNMARPRIEIRCGGLLQIRRLEKGEGISPRDPNDLLMQEVAFIHRTAHDFFTETKVGRSIVQEDSVTRHAIATCAAKGLLCLHRIIAHQHGVRAEMLCVLDQIGRLSEERNVSAVTKVTEMLPVLQSLFAEDIISGSGTWQPKCHFLAYLVPYISFHEFILYEIQKASSEKLATRVLQELCCEMGICDYTKRLVPFGLIGPLVSMGADAHACIRDQGLAKSRERHHELLVIRGSSFANFLRLSITASFFDRYKDGHLATLVSKMNVEYWQSHVGKGFEQSPQRG